MSDTPTARIRRALPGEAGYTKIIIQADPHAEQFYRAAGGNLVGTRPSASIPGRQLPLFQIDLDLAGTPKKA